MKKLTPQNQMWLMTLVKLAEAAESGVKKSLMQQT